MGTTWTVGLPAEASYFTAAPFRFGRDRVWLQLLNAYCPDDGEGDPEICFQALLKPESRLFAILRNNR